VSGCICSFPETCEGSEYLECEDCGGDMCVCRCGGVTVCAGCEECGDVEEMELGGEG